MIRAYLDNNATTPVDPRVVDAMTEVLGSNYGNPSSLHGRGRQARRVVEDARQAIADSLGGEAREIVFTSSGTEANNTAVHGLAARAPEGRRRVLTSPVEHPSVVAAVDRLAAAGFEVETLGVDADGVLDLEAARARLGDDVALSTVMWANNEVGSIQPVVEWAAACETHGVPLHVDAVQAVGKLPVCVPQGVTTLSLSGHKFHGPKGAAALWVRAESRIVPLLVGGGQERERRGGTENTAAIVGLAEAVRIADDEGAARRARVTSLEERLLRGLDAANPGAILNASGATRVPGTLSLRLNGLFGETVLMNLDLAGVAVSLGSACSSGSIEASHVLAAMGLTREENFASIRVSLSCLNTEDEIDLFLHALGEISSAAASS